MTVAEEIIDIEVLRKRLLYYTKPNIRQSLFELFITVLLFCFFWALSYGLFFVNPLLTFVFSLPAGLFLTRLFIIQHDCGHGSFFRNRKLNDNVGRVIGVITLTPYYVWKNNHAIHHATSGNLDKRGVGDINTLTVDEYRILKLSGRLAYKIYRNPFVMFGIGPAYMFFIRHRLPYGFRQGGVKYWFSTVSFNLVTCLFLISFISTIGLMPFLLVHALVILIAASIGVWLFYIQHQFEYVTWTNNDKWEFETAAIYGSSYYRLPPFLMWLTANIGIHHVHHLNSRIPFYRLSEALDDHHELKTINEISFKDSIKCFKYRLFCEKNKKLINYEEANL